MDDSQGLCTWSVRIAEAVASDEVDLAPMMTEAYVAGGDARKAMFRRSKGGPPGGFGAGQATAIFPWIVRGLAVAAPAVSAMLAATPYLKDFFSIVKDALDIHRTIQEDEAVLKDDRYETLQRAMLAVRSELETAPIPQEQRDLVVYRVMCVLLEEPSGASQFIETVGRAAHGQ